MENGRRDIVLEKNGNDGKDVEKIYYIKGLAWIRTVYLYIW